MGHTAGVSRALLSDSGKQAYTASWDNSVKLWDLATGSAQTLEGHEAYIWWMSDPHNHHMITTDNHGTVIVWDLSNRRARHTLKAHDGIANHAHISQDGKVFVTAGKDKKVRVWGMQQGEAIASVELDSAVNVAEFSPHSALLAAGTAEGYVYLWDYQEDEPYFLDESVRYEIINLAFSPSGAELAVATHGPDVSIWDVQKRIIVHTLQ